MRIAVCGKFKSGKTSLLNLLFGLELPVQAVTATRLVTRIIKGNGSYMETEDGTRTKLATDERNQLILGENNPGQSPSAGIVVGCDSPLLGEAGEMEFWDTPGLEDTAELTEITMHALERCDLAILVFDANKFGSWCEKMTLENLQDLLGGNVVYVINRIDLLNSEEDFMHVKRSANYLLKEYGNEVVGHGHILYTSASPEKSDISMLYAFVSKLAGDGTLRQALCDIAWERRMENLRKKGVLLKKPAVCPLSGQQAGTAVVLDDRQICFGRDPVQCQVLYQDGTPGVSRVHCTLVWHAGRREFVLADMNSSYGTYLDNGMRLVPGKLYFLKMGEGFYLGDVNNKVLTGSIRA